MGHPKLKSLTLIAIIVVLVGGVLFLLLPLFVGPGTGGIGGAGYTVDTSDHISSWSWTGAYLDGGDKESQTKTEIAKLKGMQGKQGQSTYDLYVGIASEYELLGDGKSAYQYLSRAIANDQKRALAYMNMGHLMEELGAFHTARTAYEKAVSLEPNNPLYQTALQNFLIHHP